MIIYHVEVSSMNKKLTLNVDEEIIRFAHEYSKETEQSISSIIEKYLLRLRNKFTHDSISPEAEEIYGIFENNTLPDKKTLRKSFYEKSID